MKAIIAVRSAEFSLNERAQDIARLLGLPFLCPGKSFAKNDVPQFYLDVTPKKLMITDALKKLSPLSVDFEKGRVDYRRRFGHKGGGHLLIKAVGGGQKKILDGTAGLGRDAFILASFGCEVTALERNSVVHALLADGLERARTHEHLKDIVSHIHLRQADLRTYLKERDVICDVIYLDPMFPVQKKTALPKKESQILRHLLDSPEDESESRELVDFSRTRARRVVVKRPLRSEPLISNPTTAYKGESTRFDVYINPCETL